MKKKTRLRQAFEDQGFLKARDAWAHHKKLFAGQIGADLFTSNANGNRAVSKNAALLYASAFGHDPAWYLYKDAAESPQQAEAQLRSALLSYGVDRDELVSVMKAINGFVDDADGEQPQSDQHRDLSEPASRRRAKAPSR